MTRAVWHPSESDLTNTRLYQMMNCLGFEDYDRFHQYSVQDIATFWHEAEQELGINWFEPYDQALDLTNGVMYPEWYVNGKMNVAYNAVEKWAHNPDYQKQHALIWESDAGDTRKFTFKELDEEVNRVANGLLDQGAQKGDIFTIYMPMIPETTIAMLAISKIGAIFSPAFSGYKAEAVATRINAAEAKYLITVDGFHRGGKTVNLKDDASEAVQATSSIEKVFVVEHAQNDVSWNNEVDIRWQDVRSSNDSFKSVHTNGNDPYMIIYTSGTTGKPKGALHTHNGFPIKSAFDAGIAMDVSAGDTLFWFTDMGWMMGPFLVYGGLLNGATILMFEGTPTYPEPDRIWDIVERHNVTHLGIAPTLIRTLMTLDESYVTKHDLSSLKLIGSTGEPWNEEPWMWLFDKVCGGRIPIFNYSGGTEISGGIFGNVLVKPIAPVGFNAALPGMDVDVYDQDGERVENEVGELVIKQPWVGMTNGFYKENERYENTYWNRFKDTWVHGDWVIHDDEGFYTITGRSDDTLNVAGKRLGPAELESIFVEHDDVVEAGVIGIPDDVKGEKPIAFVVPKGEDYDEGKLKDELINHAIDRLGKAIAPRTCHIVDDLPKTRNAKVMRRAIKSAYLNKDAGDLSALENPHVVDQIREIGKQKT
ncbi:AMP-binding protein [Alkalibacillus salilacus]|uniref:acetate--CoA ligase n=1 Tax=Alkalibacillus salilacus TaxID=284582 RepID=A0ABT9VD96_9BACI|nr:AMP-binding protein [Alkalibacillus salilacus]MDQ0158897.1 acetyl-CoA synthetase [Alkalibacillus salilacus]